METQRGQPNVVEVDNKEVSTMLGNLLDSVRECQRISTVTKEILTEANSCVSCLCQQLEIVLSHGLRKSPPNAASNVPMKLISGFQSQPELCFWNVLEPLLTKHEIDRFCNLNNITTNVGKGRAWLRCSLNEHSLERMLQTLLGDIIVLQQYYAPEAFLRNDEKASLLPQAAAGLKPVVFCIKIDDPSLDKISPNLGLQIESKFGLGPLAHVTNLLQSDVTMEEFPEAANPAVGKGSPTQKEKSKGRKKKKKRTIISFDNDRVGSSSNSETGYGIYDSEYKTVNQEFSSRTISSLSSCSEQSFDVGGEISNKEMQKKKASAIEERRTPTFGSIEDGIIENITSSFEENLPSIDHQEIPPVSSANQLLLTETASINTNTQKANLAVDALATLSLHEKNVSNAKQIDSQMDLAANHPLVKENAELQKALVVLLQRKDELVQENKQMQVMRDANEEQICALKMEVEKLKGIVDKQEASAKLDNEKNSRENDVLKNQLKRYVETVHTLQKERKNSQVDSSREQTTSESDSQDADSVSLHSNAEHEIKLYEDKLSNVAQMHGELLEFTENLHTRQISAMSLLRKMHDELVSLRGPMPTDDLIKAIEGDPNSPLPFPTLSVTGPIVNVWVPSAFMQGSGPESYHVYQVYICIADDEWNIYRRYSDFLKMHTALCKVYPQVSTFNFPPKKNIGNKSSKFVEERRKAFQTYLRKVMNNIFQSNVELKASPKKKTLLHILPFFSDGGDQCRVLLSTGKHKK